MPQSCVEKALTNIKEYPLGLLKLHQIHFMAVHYTRDDTNSSCFSIIHKSELSSINISEKFLIKKINFELNSQVASTEIMILGLYDLTRKFT